MTNNTYIVVDAQYDFIEGGSLGVNGGTAAVKRLTDHLKSENYDLVITTQDWHKDPGSHWSDNPDFKDSWPVHCKVGTRGSELQDDLKAFVSTLLPLTQYLRVLKGQYTAAYSGFEGADTQETSLLDLLRERNVDTVHVGGIATDYCVRATVLDALNAGIKVYLHTDHIAAVAEETGKAAVAEMVAAGAVIVDKEN